MPQGHALEEADTTQVVAAFNAAHRHILAVSSEPGWYVLGTFFLPQSCQATLEIQGCVSDPSLTLKARLFDMSTAQGVSGCLVSGNPLTVTRMRSGLVNLTGARSYQVQAECLGGVDDGLFAVISDATISD